MRNIPSEKITLRRLLDSTAGLPLEAPLGNYFEPSSTASFEDHVKSVFGSWLVYPVGASTSYGSTSPDLAAYVIQVVSGMPFERYVKEKLFTPLGMSASTLDRNEILKNRDRAIGHMMGMSRLSAVYPGLASGGMYSTVRDLARLVQLHINRGTLDGRRILDEALIDAIHKPVGIIRENPNVYYGMGIHIDKRSSRADGAAPLAGGLGIRFHDDAALVSRVRHRRRRPDEQAAPSGPERTGRCP